MFKRIFHKRTFYLLIAIFLAGRYFLSARNVVSFDFFNEWTVKQNLKIGQDYVKDSVVDDTIIGTTLANMTVGHWIKTNNESIISEALRLFDESTALVWVDILQLVTSSDEPKAALQAHIDHTEKTLEEIEVVRGKLNELAQDYWAKSQDCAATQNEGNQQFIEWTNQSDPFEAEAWLDQSVEASPCYITSRIKATAYAFLADKVATHEVLLKQRRDILVENFDLLVTQQAYLDDAILTQLVSLKTKLRQVNQTQLDDTNSSFFFGFLDPNATLPTFKKIWRDDGEVPNYNDSWIDRNLDNFRFETE